MEDLWSIYKSVQARTKRSIGSSTARRRAAASAARAMKAVIVQPTIENAQAFAHAENTYLAHSSSGTTQLLSSRVIEAIEKNRYVINKPPINTYALQGHGPRKGKVYVARSSRKPGEIKLGYTTLDLEKRAQLFRSRYQYEDFYIEHHAVAANPKKLESLVAERLKHLRVNVNEKGNSNEWYRCTSSDVTSLIDLVAEKARLRIDSKTWKSSSVLLVAKIGSVPDSAFQPVPPSQASHEANLHSSGGFESKTTLKSIIEKSDRAVHGRIDLPAVELEDFSLDTPLILKTPSLTVPTLQVPGQTSPNGPERRLQEFMQRALAAYLEALGSVTARESKFWRLRYSKPYGMTLQKIGDGHLLTRQRVSQILKKTRRKLMHPSRSNGVIVAFDELRAEAEAQGVDFYEIDAKVNELDRGLGYFFYVYSP